MSDVVELKTRKKTKGGSAGVKRLNFHGSVFTGHHNELLESAAWRVLNVHEHRAYNLICRTLVDVGGNLFKNGELVITHRQFIAAGVHKDRVAPSLRALEALGMVRVVWGDAGSEKYRKPNRFGITSFPMGTRKVAEMTWRLIDDPVMAKAVVKAARAKKRTDHLSWLRRSRPEAA